MVQQKIDEGGDFCINEVLQSEECQLPGIQSCADQTRQAIAALDYASVLNTNQENSLAYWQDLSLKLEKMWDQTDEQLIAVWNKVDRYWKQLKGRKLPASANKFPLSNIAKLEETLEVLEPHNRAGYLDTYISQYGQVWGNIPQYEQALEQLIEKHLPSSKRGKTQIEALKQKLAKKRLEGVLDKVYYKLFNAHIPLLTMVKETEGEIDDELIALGSLEDLTPNNLQKSLELEDDKKRIQELQLKRHNGSISKRLFEYLYWAQREIYFTGEISPLSAQDVGNQAVVIADEDLAQMDSFETIQLDGSVKDWRKDPAVANRKLLIIYPNELGNRP